MRCLKGHEYVDAQTFWLTVGFRICLALRLRISGCRGQEIGSQEMSSVRLGLRAARAVGPRQRSTFACGLHWSVAGHTKQMT